MRVRLTRAGLLVGVGFILLVAVGCAGRLPLTPLTSAAASCPVTPPNGSTPPGQPASPNRLGNGALWVDLWSDTTTVAAPQADGSIGMKFGWWRGVPGKLTIEGRRVDAPSTPLRAQIRDGYGDIGFQASGVTFPAEGCWEITAKAGAANLTFVTRVVKPQ
jgi:hypothetical protein